MSSWPRLLLTLHTFAFLAVGASQAAAQDLFANPFASAEVLRAQRGSLPNATLRLRYEYSGDKTAGQPPHELIIDVAPDWAHVRRTDRQMLYDFHLGRALELRDGGTFVSRNLMSDVVFRVQERQNRAYLMAVIRKAGAASPMDGCDTETELGVAIGVLKDPAAVEVKQSSATTSIECNGRAVGVLESGLGDKAPAALWPVLAREITMHPSLRALLAGNAPPRRVEALFKVAGTSKALSWRLVAAEPITAPYPLAANLVNATATLVNEAAAPGLGDLAAEAVAGRAHGGPPTLASWEAEVGRLAKEKGPAAAAFAAWQALNMFPLAVQACQSGAMSPLCSALRGVGATATSDAAVRALFDIIIAEQLGRPADAVAAMLGARSSPYSDHPAVGASFALALQSGGDGVQKQAQAAGLPSDAKPLHVRALQAYPYNPAYWTDLGDYYAKGYDLWTAYTLYDVAFSLPMPDAQKGNAALAGKRSFAARIRNDFPAFFLAK